MKIYKVTLKPLDWFFFGGESTFDNGEKTSYIAHSDLLPQQTALLGMVRYQLLKQNDLLTERGKKVELEKVEDLIGKDSFKMRDEEQNFGKIKGLSPVFLEKEGEKGVEAYFPISLTKGYELTFEGNVKVSVNGIEKGCLINDNQTFKQKEYDNYRRFQGEKDGELMVSKIFETRMQIGITKNTDFGQDDGDQNRFFKHEMVKFKTDDFRYVFYVELDEELKNDYVFLGAERSCFKMDVTPLPNAKSVCQVYMDKHNSLEEDGRVELLSPTYIKDMDKLNEICNFHWSYQTTFRNLTMVKDGKGKLNSGAISYDRINSKYQFLSAGSVLFFDEAKRKDVESLLNDGHMQSIGYNYYSSMNKE